MDEWQFFYVAMLGSVAFVTLVFGCLVLAQAPPRAANRYLAAFLFLIAANQTMEAVVGIISTRGYSLPGEPMLTLKQLAYVFAAADPFILFYFASVFPERNRLNHPVALMLVGTGSLLLVLFAPWSYVDRSLQLQFFALDAFTAVAYLAVFVRFAILAAREGLGSVEKLLLFGSAVAAIPVIVRATYSLGRLVALGTLVPNYAVWGVTLVLVAVALAMDGRSRLATRSFTWASVLGCSVAFLAFLPVFLAPIPPLTVAVGPFHDFVGINAPLRWLLFSLFVSIAVFRHDMLGMSMVARRRAARAAVVVALAVVAVAILSAIRLYTGGERLSFDVVDGVLVLLILAISGGFRSLVLRLADRLYGIPARDDRGHAVAVYEGAVRQAQREGRLLSVDADLARLRRELSIEALTAEVVERNVRGHAPDRLEVGATLEGRYHVEWFIGRGASGRVFRARDWLLDREVCLKEVFETATFAGDRLLAEARAAARVRHPNVVAVHDVLPRTGRVVLVIELLPGTLEDHVAARGTLSFESAVRVYDGVLAGLQAIHDAGVLHRDLKPANVFLASDGTAKIGDFGISLLAEGATLAAGDAPFGGTAGFLAPEVLDGEVPTPASDVFAVARCMERTLSEAALEGLGEVVRRALARDPRERFRSAEEMRTALRQVAARSRT